MNALDSALVDLQCVRPSHQQGGADVSDRIFIRDGVWAYCLSGQHAEDHKFLPTGGTTRKRLEGGLISKSRGPSAS